MKIPLFLKKSMFIFLNLPKKLKLKQSSEVKFFSSTLRYSCIIE